MNAIRPKTLAIIPARKGSKRLPGKNILPLSGKPLIGWTVAQACQCQYFDKIIVSTDCDEIARVATTFGAEVPFIRPAELAQDKSSSYGVVEHALTALDTHYDVIALLEPTSPLRTKQDLNLAMQLFIENYANYDAVISVGKIEREHPAILKKIDQANTLTPFRFVDEGEVYFPYGVIYATKVQSLLETKTFYPAKSLPYKVARWQNFEIDDAIDFACVEKMIEMYQDLL